MTISDLGSLGELVAAIATVATLIYLAIQIRSNTRVSRVESRRTTTAQTLEFSALIAANSEVASIFRRGLADPTSLDADEKIRFNFLFSMLVYQTQSSFEDSKFGILGEDIFDLTAVPVFNMLKTPGGTAYWQFYGKGFVPAFRDKVEKAMAN